MPEFHRIVLASCSPRRADLLNAAGIKFITAKHNVSEENVISLKAEKLAEKLALMKVRSISDMKEYENELILGVDTTVVYNGTILDKPADRDEAERNIRRLSGKTHKVITGLALISKNARVCIVDRSITTVSFQKLNNDFIKYYLDNNHFQGYAGGYAIQGIFSLVVKKINGSYSGIVGLPMEILYKHLYKINFKFC